MNCFVHSEDGKTRFTHSRLCDFGTGEVHFFTVHGYATASVARVPPFSGLAMMKAHKVWLWNDEEVGVNLVSHFSWELEEGEGMDFGCFSGGFC